MRVLLDVDSIKTLASNQKVFIRGRNLFNAKERIGPLYYDPDKHWVKAKVSSFSGNVYDTVIGLHSNGTPMSCSCSCKSFGMFKGACKHVVGLLFSVVDKKFSDEGEVPDALEPRHPLAEEPQIYRPLLSFDELMEISSQVEGKEKKRRGRPPKPKTESSVVKQPLEPVVTNLLFDQTVSKDNYIPIKPGVGEEVQVAEKAPEPYDSGGKQLLNRLFYWENWEKNLTRSEVPSSSEYDAVCMELQVELTKGLSLQAAQLSMKLGTKEHLYVVQSIPEFLRAYLRGEAIEFGAYFTWQKNQGLSHGQQRVIDWLKLAYMDSQTVGALRPENGNGQKNLGLSYEMLRQFLVLSRQVGDDVKVDLKLDYAVFPLVFRETLPHRFALHLGEIAEKLDEKSNDSNKTFACQLTAREGERTLAIANLMSNKGKLLTETDFLILHEDFIAIYDSVVYLLKDKSDRLIWQAIMALARSKENLILLDAAEVSYFLTLAKVHLEAKRRLLWDDQLDSRLKEEDLEIRTYIDYVEDKLWLSAFYFYGEHYFRPLYREALPRYKDKIDPGVLIVRHLRDENRFSTLLSKMSFHTIPLKESDMAMISRSKNGNYMTNQFYIEEEEDLFYFLQSGMKQIQSQATLYVSPQFKSFEVLVPTEPKLELDYTETEEWITLEISMDGYSNEEAAEIVRAYQKHQIYARLDTYRFVDLESNGSDTDWVLKLGNLVKTLATWGATWYEGKFRISRYRSLALQNLLEEEGIAVQSRDNHLLEAWQRLREDHENPGLRVPTLPDGINAELRPYQVEGYQWLSYLDRYGFGGVLADEMGLGKTLQVLSFLWAKYQEHPGQYLVVSPTSLLYNWEQEVKRFLPHMPVYVVEGTKPNRVERLKFLQKKHGIIIISYGIARQDKKELSGYLFDYVVIDEAQSIKNPTTKTSRAVKALRAKRRFALTGTPIENHIGELWSIFDFIMPGYLFHYSVFQERFGQASSASQTSGEEWLHAHQEALVQQRSLHQLVSPFILRRLKTDVLEDLPDKIVTDLPVHMTSEQQKLYRQHLERARRQLRNFETANKSEQNKHRMNILGELTRLRQICCDPALFVPNYTGGSGKLEALEDLLDNLLDGNHRILLFSQFTSMLSIIRELLHEKGIRTMYIDGQVPAKERLDMVDAFNNGVGDVFLISLKAGGTGLNLTGADVVIHYDPWWNPAVENQATDRAHRIGQRHIVQVYRLITKGSIEEKIQELQERKQALLEDIVSPGAKSIHRMHIDEIKGLFMEE